jgi:hypothetical protein
MGNTVTLLDFCSVCPADLQGRLRKATRLKGIEGFRASEMGLRPMHVQTWGAFVFVAHDPGCTTLESWLGEGGVALLPRLPSAEAFVHVGRREYMLQCNWKVGDCCFGMLRMVSLLFGPDLLQPCES